MGLKLTFQKRLAADLLKCGIHRVKLDPEKLEEISEAITREEIRQLIKGGAIKKKQKKGVSRARVRARKKKRGPGSRKGGKYSRLSRKEQWMRRVRAQRKRLRELRDRGLVTKTVYRKIYRMVKAGAFKSVAAMMEYLEQKKLIRRPLL